MKKIIIITIILSFVYFGQERKENSDENTVIIVKSKEIDKTTIKRGFNPILLKNKENTDNKSNELEVLDIFSAEVENCNIWINSTTNIIDETTHEDLEKYLAILNEVYLDKTPLEN